MSRRLQPGAPRTGLAGAVVDALPRLDALATAGGLTRAEAGVTDRHRHAHQLTMLGPWRANDQAANTTGNLRLPTDGAGAAGGIPTLPMPYPGRVRVLAINGHTVLSAGSATFTITKNGSSQASPSVVLTTGESLEVAKVGTNALRFVAGDTLGIQIATSAAYAPTTADWLGLIYVEFDLTDE